MVFFQTLYLLLKLRILLNQRLNYLGLRRSHSAHGLGFFFHLSAEAVDEVLGLIQLML